MPRTELPQGFYTSESDEYQRSNISNIDMDVVERFRQQLENAESYDRITTEDTSFHDTSATPNSTELAPSESKSEPLAALPETTTSVETGDVLALPVGPDLAGDVKTGVDLWNKTELLKASLEAETNPETRQSMEEGYEFAKAEARAHSGKVLSAISSGNYSRSQTQGLLQPHELEQPRQIDTLRTVEPQEGDISWEEYLAQRPTRIETVTAESGQVLVRDETTKRFAKHRDARLQYEKDADTYYDIELKKSNPDKIKQLEISQQLTAEVTDLDDLEVALENAEESNDIATIQEIKAAIINAETYRTELESKDINGLAEALGAAEFNKYTAYEEMVMTMIGTKLDAIRQESEAAYDMTYNLVIALSDAHRDRIAIEAYLTEPVEQPDTATETTAREETAVELAHHESKANQDSIEDMTTIDDLSDIKPINEAEPTNQNIRKAIRSVKDFFRPSLIAKKWRGKTFERGADTSLVSEQKKDERKNNKRTKWIAGGLVLTAIMVGGIGIGSSIDNDDRRAAEHSRVFDDPKLGTEGEADLDALSIADPEAQVETAPDPRFVVDQSEGGIKFFDDMGLSQAQWYEVQSDLLQNFPNEFYQPAGSAVRITNQGPLSNGAQKFIKTKFGL